MRGRRAQGFTLLEVILALGLTGLILVALGMAIDFHFRVLDAGRAHVEEGQLARVLLRRIADDLRAAVHGAASDAAAASGDSQESESSEPTVVHARPGIYGDSSLIQIDVSRLPRPYQLQEMITSAADSLDANTLSDVKTVTYFAASSQSAAIAQLPLTSTPEQGLMRCEMDRAVAAYQAEQGGLSPVDTSAVLLAPEVAGVEFLYFDGSQWVDFWDTSQNGGLPVAVRVTLYITPKQTKQRRGPQSQEAAIPAGESASTGDTLAYSLLVNIPAAQATSTSGASGWSSDASTLSGSANTGNTGGGNTGGGNTGSSGAGGTRNTPGPAGSGAGGGGAGGGGAGKGRS